MAHRKPTNPEAEHICPLSIENLDTESVRTLLTMACFVTKCKVWGVNDRSVMWAVHETMHFRTHVSEENIAEFLLLAAETTAYNALDQVLGLQIEQEMEYKAETLRRREEAAAAAKAEAAAQAESDRKAANQLSVKRGTTNTRKRISLNN